MAKLAEKMPGGLPGMLGAAGLPPGMPGLPQGMPGLPPKFPSGPGGLPGLGAKLPALSGFPSLPGFGKKK
jgi:preprotein translocase subunit SecD